MTLKLLNAARPKFGTELATAQTTAIGACVDA